MKRRLISVRLVVLVLGTGALGLAWWQPTYMLKTMAVMSPEFTAQAIARWREKLGESTMEEGKINLEKEVVRIELEGRRYNVPMRYMYGEAIEKNNQWPKANAERVKVGGLTLSVLLPNMTPYYPKDDARWNVLGYGDRLEVAIAKPVGSLEWFHFFRSGYLSGEDKLATRMLDANGLTRFAYRQMEDVYFPIDGDLELVISCSSKPATNDISPGCRTKSNYKYGVVLEYSYGKNYLEHWREIDSTIKAMFNAFEEAANAEFKGQGR